MARRLRLVYTALFALATPLLLARTWWRGRRNPALRRAWPERLGHYRAPPPALPVLWVHAVSVGESVAAAPLVDALAARWPDLPVLVTSTTATGADTVRRLLGDRVITAWFPYDLPWVLARFFAHFRPRLLVVMETELWPNTLAACTARGVPVMLANARLSARSLAGYRRCAPLARAMVRAIDCIAAQSEADAARFVALGAPPAQVTVAGSLKFDVAMPSALFDQVAATVDALGAARPRVIAASTRPGEEALLLEAWRTVCATLPVSPLLVLVPRHPERFDEVAALCAARGFHTQRLSGGARCDARTEVFLVDAMGVLARYCAACDVAFVGGSLLPFGGHNVLEPAAVGTPVVVGPHTFNFTEIVAWLAQSGGLVAVADGAALAAAVLHWLQDDAARARAGAAARAALEGQRGATARTVAAIVPLLERTQNARR